MDEKDVEDDIAEEEMDEVLQPEPKPTPTPRAPEGAGFMGRMWHYQNAIDRKVDGLGRGRFARVLRMARKPEPEEFRQSAVIVLVGIAIIGGIGFFIYLLMQALLKAVTPV